MGFLALFLFTAVFPVSGTADIDVEAVRLAAFHNGTDINVVDAEIVLTVSRPVVVLLEGDIKTKALFDGFPYEEWVTRSGDGLLIYYDGPLELTGQKTAGDAVDVLIRYGDDSRAVEAAVERP